VQSEKQSRLLFTLGRFWGFLKRLVKNKKSAFGLLVIAFFLFLAFGAPLVTPYNAMGEIQGQAYWPISAPNVGPAWLKNLPTWLGGNPTLSDGMRVVQHPGRPSLGELNFTWSKNGNGAVTANVDENVGFPLSAPPGFSAYTENGSLAVKYSREAGAVHNETEALLCAEFDWPWTGPPGRFTGNLELLVNGTLDHIQNVTTMDPITGLLSVRTHRYLDVPIKVNVFIEKVGGKKWDVWPMPEIYLLTSLPQGFKEDKSREIFDSSSGYNITMGRYAWGIDEAMNGFPELGGWIISRRSPESQASSIDSTAPELVNKYTVFGSPSYPERNIFVGPGKYIYGLELTFVDQGNSTKNVETTVHVDDFGMFMYGTSFGLLGSDEHGRDLFSQLIYGTRISLYLGIMVAFFSVFIGLAVGLAAGYLGRVVDEILMRITDVLLVLPGLPLLVVLVAVLGATLNNLVILLGVLGWMGYARLVRSQVLSIKERPFVEASKAVGASKLHIIVNHVLPSVMSLVYVSLATAVPGAVTAEAALSWLGFFDPQRMSWGRMLYDMFSANAITAWWWVIPPGLCIAMLAASFILVGFALDEVLNPKLRLRK
jgi:peptide/nickel transport system permease protein